MRLKSPRNLHYPVTVTALLKKPNDPVGVADAIFSYYYTSRVTEGNEWGEEKVVDRKWPTNFECDVEGTIAQWCIEKGTVIEHADIDLVEIEETCPHSTQFGGMCAMCGKDMTNMTYAQSRPDTARADTNVAHAHKDLRISSAEASRMDQESKRKLLSSRKLSLVVDLDLTIIQATVDPTIGEWQNDPANPNYEAVKNVRSFELRDDALGRNVAYYVKMRPGLLMFLDNISRLFELHIYTMGTRNYATEIAKIVDPTQKLFADRILSRTETPGEDSKNLRKLFPVDTKMVVIIDDRMDVWRNSPYLVKVTPYNFFTGIGDIHGSFLDKRYEEENKALSLVPIPPSDAAAVDTNGSTTTSATVEPPEAEKTLESDDAALEQFVTMRSSEDGSSLQEKTAAAEEALATQLSDRPLLQQQKALEKAEAEAEANSEHPQDEPAKTPPVLRHSLLQDDDTELMQLENALTRIHGQFYSAYDENVAKSTGRVAELRNGSSPKKRKYEADVLSVPDVKTIIKPLKSHRLKDCIFVFTGVIPIGLDVHLSRFAQLVRELGAQVRTKVDRRTTHVIAAPDRPTHKVRAALRNPRTIITTAAWLQEQWSHWWKRIDPADFPVSGLPAPNEGEESTLDSLDDGDDDDDEADEEENADEAIDPEAGSPQHEFKPEEWDDMDAQLADFLDSEDGESDATSGKEDDDDEADSDEEGSGLHKRKRSIDSDGEGDVQTTSATKPDSQLQKRKRQAMERTSSLTHVVTLPPTPEAGKGNSLPSSGNGTDQTLLQPGAGHDGDDGESADDAEFEAALEAELEAASDEEQDGGD